MVLVLLTSPAIADDYWGYDNHRRDHHEYYHERDSIIDDLATYNAVRGDEYDEIDTRIYELRQERKDIDRRSDERMDNFMEDVFSDGKIDIYDSFIKD